MGAHEAKDGDDRLLPPARGRRLAGRASYFINTYEPETRPRYEAEALAFHEAVPGHHLQIAIAQELTRLPAFRRLLGSTAFVEGWGLYTERLSRRDGPLLGRPRPHRHAVARRVARVPARRRHRHARARLDAAAGDRRSCVEHTALAENNIVNEVDRYIVWPGQALAYKIGQLEILRLRAEAEARSGARFDIRAFHDAVLGEGALGLRTLGRVVRARLGMTA